MLSTAKVAVSCVNAHAHPSSILAHVVDTIRSDSTQLGNDEVVDPHRLRISLESKLSTAVFEVSHQLLLLSIDRDDRLTLPQEASDFAVDMLKLSIAIRMRRAFQSLGVCLQAIAQLVQQLRHQTLADAVTATAQLLGQFAHALASPPQRRLGVTPAQRLDQRLQLSHHGCV